MKGIQGNKWTPAKQFEDIFQDKQWKKPVKGKWENAGFAGYVFTLAWMTHEKPSTQFDRLERYINKYGLGTFTRCEPGTSGLYGGHHTIQIGVWTPDREAAFKAFKFGIAKGWIPASAEESHWKHDPIGGAVVWGGADGNIHM
jgi:hypothetical protein